MNTDGWVVVAQPGYRFRLPPAIVEIEVPAQPWSLRQFEQRDVALNVSTYCRPISFSGRLGLESAVGSALTGYEAADTEVEVLVDDEDRREVAVRSASGDPSALRLVALRLGAGDIAMLEIVQPISLQSDHDLFDAIAISFVPE